MKDSCFAVKKCFCHRGKYFLKYFENKMSNLLKTTIFFVQNRLFYHPEFISAFLSSYFGLILSLKNPQRQLYHIEFESISMLKLPLYKTEFEIQREIKRACPPSLSRRALENLYAYDDLVFIKGPFPATFFFIFVFSIHS